MNLLLALLLLFDGTASLFQNVDAKYLEALKYVLTKREHDELKRLPSRAEQEAWIQQYWQRQDPTPLDGINEARIDFEKRLQYVRLFYNDVSKRGFDDRGLIYLRFGEPDDRYVETMPGPFLDNQPLGVSVQRRANESWVYYGIDSQVVSFDFVDRGSGSFRLAIDLSEALVIRSRGMSQVLPLYAARAHLGGIYQTIAMSEGEEVQQTLINETQLNATVQATLPPLVIDRRPANQIPFQLRLSQFKNPGNKTALFCSYAIPGDKLAFVPENGGVLQAQIKQQSGLLDTLQTMLQEQEETVTLAVQEEGKQKVTPLLNTFSFAAAPGPYVLAMELVDKRSGKKGRFKDQVLLRDFSTRYLTLSDLILAVAIKPAVGNRDRFVRNGLGILPYPFGKLSRQHPIHLYAEIYNLTFAEDGKGRYEVSVAIGKAKRPNVFGRLWQAISGGGGQRVALSSTFSTTRREETFTVQLDLSTAEVGASVITLRVHDLVSGEQAESARQVTIVR